MRDENKSNEEEQDEYRKAGFTVRTKAFALRVIKLYAALPKRHEAQILGVKSSVRELLLGAYYREACRAKSDADFISKIEGGLQELDETVYWAELIGEAGIFSEKRLRPLCDEAEELIAMFVTMVKNVKDRKAR